MFRHRHSFAALALLGCAAVASAQIYVQAPGTRVAVGGGRGVRVAVGAQVPPPVVVPEPGFPPAVVTPPPTVIVAPPAVVPVVPAPVVPAPVMVRVLSLDDFLDNTCFRAGTYNVHLIHPCTKCPVKVCFCLPVAPKKIVTRGNNVEFRWGLLCCKSIVLNFLPDGRVRVLD